MTYAQGIEWAKKQIEALGAMPIKTSDLRRMAEEAGVWSASVRSAMADAKYRRRWLIIRNRRSLYWAPSEWNSSLATRDGGKGSPRPKVRSKYDTSTFVPVTCSPQVHQFIKDRAHRSARPISDVTDEMMRDHIEKTCGVRLPRGEKMQPKDPGVRTAPKFGPDVIVPVVAAEAIKAAQPRPPAEASPAIKPKVQSASEAVFDPASLYQSHIVGMGWAKAAIAPKRHRPDRRAAKACSLSAADWLRRYLGSKCGVPVRSGLVFNASKAAGFPREHIRKAAGEIGAKIERAKTPDSKVWLWSL